MEKVKTPQEVLMVDQINYPAKVSFNWFGAKEIVAKPVDLDNIYDDLAYGKH